MLARVPLVELALCVLGQGPYSVASVERGPTAVEAIRFLPDLGLASGGQTWDSRTWAAVRRSDRALPAGPAAPFVTLTSGDRWPLAGLDGLALADERFEANVAGPLAPARFASAQALVSALCTGGESDAFDRWLRETARFASDGVLLFNGDRIRGTLRRVDGAGCSIESDGRTTQLPWARVAGLRFNPDSAAPVRTRKAHLHVVLANGARVRLASLETAGDRLRGKTLFGASVDFPADALAGAWVRQGAATYLGDLKPADFQATPFFDQPWSFAVDRSLLGHGLSLGKDAYDFGLAMHSRSKITYALDPGAQTFEATVGVDRQAGPRGAASAQVLVDGVVRFARLVRAGDAPLAVRVDLRGAKALTLVADFGPEGDVQSHLFWTDARILSR